MKYLKTYEDNFYNVHKQLEPKKLDVTIGDYFVKDHNVYDDDKIVIRKGQPYQITNIDKDNTIYYICDDGVETCDIYSKEYQKISKEEAKFLKDIENYNL